MLKTCHLQSVFHWWCHISNNNLHLDDIISMMHLAANACVWAEWLCVPHHSDSCCLSLSSFSLPKLSQALEELISHELPSFQFFFVLLFFCFFLTKFWHSPQKITKNPPDNIRCKYNWIGGPRDTQALPSLEERTAAVVGLWMCGCVACESMFFFCKSVSDAVCSGLKSITCGVAVPGSGYTLNLCLFFF